MIKIILVIVDLEHSESWQGVRLSGSARLWSEVYCVPGGSALDQCRYGGSQ